MRHRPLGGSSTPPLPPAGRDPGPGGSARLAHTLGRGFRPRGLEKSQRHRDRLGPGFCASRFPPAQEAAIGTTWFRGPTAALVAPLVCLPVACDPAAAEGGTKRGAGPAALTEPTRLRRSLNPAPDPAGSPLLSPRPPSSATQGGEGETAPPESSRPGGPGTGGPGTGAQGSRPEQPCPTLFVAWLTLVPESPRHRRGFRRPDKVERDTFHLIHTGQASGKEVSAADQVWRVPPAPGPGVRPGLPAQDPTRDCEKRSASPRALGTARLCLPLATLNPPKVSILCFQPEPPAEPAGRAASVKGTAGSET